ncbi:MAG: YheT family hydrolase [Gemmatimonadota bacterium]
MMHLAYRPAWWLPGPHLESLWGRLGRRGPLVTYRRETLETPDDDRLELDWVDGPAGAPLLLALHGLEGCSQSLYVQGMLSLAQARGWRGVALNFRSCAPPPGRPRQEWVLNRAERMYHSGETEDLDWLVGRLVAREPDLRLLLAGVSLGGNVLLKWLGERGGEAPPAVLAAATISVPYDLSAAAHYMEVGFRRVYMRDFLRRLRPKVLQFAARYPERVNVDAVRTARTFRTFDAAAVAPIHGFTDAEDYYARSSSLGYLARIAVPTLLVSAVNDPFLPPEVLDDVRHRAAPAVTCAFTARGGHAGFVTGPPWACHHWAEERVIDFLADHVHSPRATPLAGEPHPE